MDMNKKADPYWRRGEPMVWVTGGALAAILFGAVTLLVVLLVNGLSYFWPSRLEELQLADGRIALGRRMGSMSEGRNRTDFAFRTANKGFDPKTQTQAIQRIKLSDVVASSYPPEAVVVERLENSDFYGALAEVQAPDLSVAGVDSIGRLQDALRQIAARRAGELDPLERQIADISGRRDAVQNAQLRLIHQKETLDSSADPDRVPADGEQLAAVSRKIAALQADLASLDVESRDRVNERSNLEAQLRKNVAVFHDSQGQPRSIALVDVIRVYQPNSMGLLGKVGLYVTKVWELLSTAPRESNTEGGVLPALFGTVTLIILMALCSFPLGVLAGVYLGEYAQDGVLVRLVRIGVNNLAGIPSIVYGIFGVGFFINYLGAKVDHALFRASAFAGTCLRHRRRAVGVADAGALDGPRGHRGHGRGDPRHPARRAGEFLRAGRDQVPDARPRDSAPGLARNPHRLHPRDGPRCGRGRRPLMLTGVVNSAATLPLDGKFPYFHLERQFMHLGYQIYSVAFQSPDAEAARPLVYVIALLLVLIVLLLSGLAIYLRNRMRKTLQLRTI